MFPISYTIFYDAIDVFYTVFGNGYIMAILIILCFVIMLSMFRANFLTIFFVILPLLLAFTVNSTGTNFIEFAPYILIGAFIIMGFVVWSIMGIKVLGR